MRGEDKLIFAVSLATAETPPRAWGRRKLIPDGHNLCGNTPTCVGKTLELFCQYIFKKKHPHVRGEDKTFFHRNRDQEETPPRAWGRPWGYCPHTLPIRNTPTCVGKTNGQRHSACHPQKHPHVRGEDISPAFWAAKAAETPPRAWGRPSQLTYPPPEVGNTPTCVGKTPYHPSPDLQQQKHPHVRGEDWS